VQLPNFVEELINRGLEVRMVVLDKELVVSAPQGYNWLMFDEFYNGYDACKEGACSFIP
jgi:hypothetical protein